MATAKDIINTAKAMGVTKATNYDAVLRLLRQTADDLLQHQNEFVVNKALQAVMSLTGTDFDNDPAIPRHIAALKQTLTQMSRNMNASPDHRDHEGLIQAAMPKFGRLIQAVALKKHTG